MKAVLRSIFYCSGLLRLVHFLRNRRTLTVFMFHRVLPATSDAFLTAEKEFTFSIDGFGRTLDFIRQNYNVVSNEAILSNVERNAPLPNRAALITFDDGWRDTLIYAMPELKRRQLPAVLFLATEVIELSQNHWWQDRLVQTLSISGNRERLEALLGIKSSMQSVSSHLKEISSQLAALPDSLRHEMLDRVAAPYPLERQMLRVDDIASIKDIFAISGHSNTHAALTHCVSFTAELSKSQAALKAFECDSWAMSFPHGAYNATLASAAYSEGFKVLFTSDPYLIDIRSQLSPKQTLGRIHVPENDWTCTDNRISFSKLATFFFFRPVAR